MITRRSPGSSSANQKHVLTMRDVQADVDRFADLFRPELAIRAGIAGLCAIVALAIALLAPAVLLKLAALVPAALAAVFVGKAMSSQRTMLMIHEIANGLPRGNFAVFEDEILEIRVDRNPVRKIVDGDDAYYLVTRNQERPIRVSDMAGKAAKAGDMAWLIRDAQSGNIVMTYLKSANALDQDLAARVVPFGPGQGRN